MTRGPRISTLGSFGAKNVSQESSQVKTGSRLIRVIFVFLLCPSFSLSRYSSSFHFFFSFHPNLWSNHFLYSPSIHRFSSGRATESTESGDSINIRGSKIANERAIIRLSAESGNFRTGNWPDNEKQMEIQGKGGSIFKDILQRCFALINGVTWRFFAGNEVNLVNKNRKIDWRVCRQYLSLWKDFESRGKYRNER